MITDSPDILRHLPANLDPTLVALIQSAAVAAHGKLGDAGLDAYIRGLMKLKANGAGWAPLVAYLRQVPQVVEILDASVIQPLIEAAMRVSERAGAAPLDQFFATSTLAAQKLGDTLSFLEYLRLISETSAVSPGVLPLFFDRLPTLLDGLTITGLRRWVQVGLRTHSRDADAQKKYFSLDSKDAIAMLKLGGEGTLFSHVHRRLQLYLRALWWHEWIMHPKAKKDLAIHNHRPFIDDETIYLPDAYGGKKIGPGAELYRAAAAHAAAHLTFTRARFKVGNYKPIKIVVVSMLEDARVEALAIREFPGLRNFWKAWHVASPELGGTFVELTARLSRALLDPDYADDHPWVVRGRSMWAENQARLEDQNLSVELANPLANDIGQTRLQFNYKTYVVQPPCRDDHSFMWHYGDDNVPPTLDEDDDIVLEEIKTNPREVDQLDQPELRDAQVEDPDPEKKEQESRHAIALELGTRTVDYGEWDYTIGLERPSWCTLFEKQPVLGDPSLIDAVLHRHEGLQHRVKALIRAAQIQQALRLRKQHEGDRMDLDAAIRAVIDLRSAHDPDPRINMRTVRRGRDLSVLVLLDLSKSTGDIIRSENTTVLNLARESLVLLAEAMSELGDEFAIHGFTSNGRRDVSYFRFKDFAAPYGPQAKAALAGITPLLSTRMGPAIRHAGEFLRAQASGRKLLLVITDGEPSDIDIHDPRYLMMDAKKACEGLMRHGIQPFCMSLDSSADKYVSTIFGRRNYLVMDKIARLPEKLPLIYLRMTQH
ncbi:MAG: VWA domain-containing protein [Pseudomonadota bacterium]|nr:VWA domain-containing protein [Pseudomonadota bacterium]